jgi:hypothetical protein
MDELGDELGIELAEGAVVSAVSVLPAEHPARPRTATPAMANAANVFRLMVRM